MFCVKCGQQLPDDANFCLKCGTPLKAENRQADIRWETCEIKISHVEVGFWNHQWQVWAEAIGPEGRYSAAESAKFKVPQTVGDTQEQSGFVIPRDRFIRPHFDKLIDRLVNDGWEPVETRGPTSYSLRFRRRVQ